MSDSLQNDGGPADKDGLPDKREGARRMAEAALRARAEGDDDRAEELLAQAERTDPEAVADVLAQRGAPGSAPDAAPMSDADADAEVAAISRTIEPGSSAPSRANITGPGSGADNL